MPSAPLFIFKPSFKPSSRSSSPHKPLLRWICVLLGCLTIPFTSAGGSVSDQFKRMQPCPSSPNCVSSIASPGSHFIEPLIDLGDSQALISRIQTNLEKDPAFSIVESEPSYLRVEARSRFFGFVDDVEFRIRQDSNTVDMRSGSRVGYSDLGKNRRRLEAVRKSLIRQASTSP